MFTNVANMTLTREDEEGNEIEYNLDVQFFQEPPEYEGRYMSFPGSLLIEGATSPDGTPFDLTEEDIEQLKSKISRSSKMDPLRFSAWWY